MSGAIFAVTFTEYVDDYKLRGRNPSTTIGPVLFKTREAADKFLCTHLAAFIVDHVSDNLDEDTLLEEFELEELFDHNPNTETLTVKHIMADNVPAFEAAVAQFNEGEFVPCRCSWTLDQFSMADLK